MGTTGLFREREGYLLSKRSDWIQSTADKEDRSRGFDVFENTLELLGAVLWKTYISEFQNMSIPLEKVASPFKKTTNHPIATENCFERYVGELEGLDIRPQTAWFAATTVGAHSDTLLTSSLSRIL